MSEVDQIVAEFVARYRDDAFHLARLSEIRRMLGEMGDRCFQQGRVAGIVECHVATPAPASALESAVEVVVRALEERGQHELARRVVNHALA